MKFAIVGGFIIVDIITGILSAIMLRKWSSTKMREGLFHKMGFIIFISLSVLCDFGQQYLNLGFAIPITNSVITYVCATETGSCLENLAIINPNLVPEKIRTILIKTKE